MIDGSRALRKAIVDVFGESAVIQRCRRHKERNLTDSLPDKDRDRIRSRLRTAWALKDHHLARVRAREKRQAEATLSKSVGTFIR